jgi:uncharacterized protein (TIGR00251 family)
MAENETPLRPREDKLLLRVKVFPKAGSNRIDGVRAGELLLRIRAPALGGEANRELVKYLAKVLNVQKSEIRILSGERSRHKLLGLPRGAGKELEKWL